MDDLRQQLEAVLHGKAPAEEKPEGGATTPAAVAEAVTLSAPPAAPAEPLPAVAAPAEVPAPAPAKSVPGAAEERVVRVTAQNLTRLMRLAGESLVEARWLQPFTNSLLRLKQQQAKLDDELDELWQALPDGPAAERGRALLTGARQRLAGCNRLLADRVDEFEAHTRKAAGRNVGLILARQVLKLEGETAPGCC